MTLQAGWILLACIALAIVLIVAGAVAAAISGLRVKRHADALKKSPILGYPAEAQALAHRIDADLAQMQPLLERAKIAIDTINRSLQQLRMPEAVLAVRTAGAAIRLLFPRR